MVWHPSKKLATRLLFPLGRSATSRWQTKKNYGVVQETLSVFRALVKVFVQLMAVWAPPSMSEFLRRQ